jgi:WhiB family redox-sensing transcriptional regulator
VSPGPAGSHRTAAPAALRVPGPGAGAEMVPGPGAGAEIRRMTDAGDRVLRRGSTVRANEVDRTEEDSRCTRTSCRFWRRSGSGTCAGGPRSSATAGRPGVLAPCWTGPGRPVGRMPRHGTDAPELPCQSDPELFFAEAPQDVVRAKALCRQCPVRHACLAGALQRAEPWGVWGGELLLHGTVIAAKRPRGRPRKNAVAA